MWKHNRAIRQLIPIGFLWLVYQTVYANHLSLQQTINIALQDNPGIAEIKARADAMAAIPSQVGALPDPVVSFKTLNVPVDTFDLDQENMTQLQFGISQKIPFPGKLALREEAAEYQAEAAENNVAEARLLLIRDVKTLWWRLFYLDRSLQILESNKDLLRQFVEIAQTKYSVGQGLQQDVLLAQLELSKQLDNEIQLASTRTNQAARLNALLNLTPDTPLHLPDKIQLTLPQLLPEEKLFLMADTSRPLLAEKKNLINAAQSRLNFAKKDRYPDLNVGAFYGIRSGENLNTNPRADFLSLSLSVNIPLFSNRKQNKAIDQHASELLQSNYAMQDDRIKVQEQITKAASNYRRANKQFELFESGIIPLAQQTVASMLAGYQVNKVDFLNLVRAQVTLINYEKRYWLSITEAYTYLAMIQAAVGKELIHE